MGGSTAAIGLLPTFKTAGWEFAHLIVRLIVITAGYKAWRSGGEYGGAAVYLAEHVPDGKRGLYTSYIQITAGLGFVISLAVILITEHVMAGPSFQLWGWRLPFLLSLVLVSISLYIRIQMKESPIFSEMKAAGTNSTKPLRDAFGNLGET